MKLDVTVTTRASRNEVIRQPDGSYKVRITTPPVDGKANEVVIKLLAKHFNVPKTGITILRGQTSRNKLIEIKTST